MKKNKIKTRRKNKIRNKIYIDCQDFWVMILGLVRYSMGRKTYVANVCEDILKRNVRYISVINLNQLVSEIYNRLRMSEASRLYLGDPVDHLTWIRICSLIENEIDKREIGGNNGKD